MGNPLILTLAIDAPSQRYFDTLRKTHFPPGRNFLDAHLTIFHQLPAGEQAIITDLQKLATGTSAFRMVTPGLINTGNGVAFKIHSDELARLQRYLQHDWQQWLIPQDKQGYRPHITIQNKLDAATAKRLMEELSADFTPFEITATGLILWEYLGGPWRFVERFDFNPSQTLSSGGN